MSVAHRDNDEILTSKAEKALYKIKKVSREFQVPYLAGYSKDRETLYIDCDSARGYESDGRFVETDPFLCVHEFVEDSCMNNGASYPLGHSMATAAERGCVEDAGLRWDEYCHFMDLEVKNAEGRKEFDNLPPDLDLAPYTQAQDKTDLKLLKRMGYYG